MPPIHSDRLARLRARMRETGTDLVALGPSSHMRWLSGVDPHGDERPVMLLVGREAAGFLMPALNADAARNATDLPFHTWDDASGPDAALADLLARCGIGKGASLVLDETMRTDFALRLLDALDAPRRRFTGDTVGLLRARKDPDEYAALHRSARINDLAMEAGFAALEDGMSENDLKDAIRAIYAEHDATPEFTIVAFGANGAFPHHHTGETKLRRDSAVLIDTGGRRAGYPSDMTRCGWFGTPDPDFLEVAGVVERAVLAALAAARPGVAASVVDRAARDVITQAGHGAHFLHRTGHGLGIDVHEPPYITATSDTILEPGHVFSIEPGIYLAGRFGIRLEDIVILRADGPEILSGQRRDIVIVPAP